MVRMMQPEVQQQPAGSAVPPSLDGEPMQLEMQGPDSPATPSFPPMTATEGGAEDGGASEPGVFARGGDEEQGGPPADTAGGVDEQQMSVEVRMVRPVLACLSLFSRLSTRAHLCAARGRGVWMHGC